MWRRHAPEQALEYSFLWITFFYAHIITDWSLPQPVPRPQGPGKVSQAVRRERAVPLLQYDCFEGLPTPIYHSGQKPGLVCGEVGILDKMRIASTISALSEIYAILLNTPAGVECVCGGGMAWGRWG